MKEVLRNNDKTDMEYFAYLRKRTVSQQVRRAWARQMRSRFQLFMHNPFVRRPLFWIGTVLGFIWASPLTAFGLLLAVPVMLLKGHMQFVRGHTFAILARGPFADAMLSRHPFGAMNAMALGHVVIATRDGLSSRVLMHELVHVRQAARWGIVFPLAYLASSAWAAARGRDAYWHNRFEVAARKAEKHI